MATYIIDASVGIKWFIPEPHEQAAELLLNEAYDLWVPDLFYVELANILWKRVQFQKMDEKIARNSLLALESFPLLVASCASLNKTALDLALRIGCTAYDGLYVALAVREDAQLITSDRQLYKIIQATPLAKYILMIDDFPAKALI